MSVDAARVQNFGAQIKGPSALGGSFTRFVSLTWTLAYLDFKLKFFGSVLGYFWQLMKPLMMFGVLYAVFTQFVRIGGASVKHFPVVLLAGIVMYTFFAEATSGSVTAVVDRENLVRKIHFPRLVIPLATVLTTYLNFLLNFVAVVVFMLISGIEPSWGWLELIPLVLFLGAFSLGIGMILSANYARFRDLKPIWDVVVSALFYATPIFYSIEVVREKAGERVAELMIMLNPLAVVIQQIRHAVIDPTAPSAAAAAGGAVHLLVPIGIVFAAVVLGFWTFDRQAPYIAENL